MNKYYAIKSRVDGLPLYAYAPTPEAAVKAVEELVGPMNPNSRTVVALADCPEGYTHLNIDRPHLLAEIEEFNE